MYGSSTFGGVSYGNNNNGKTTVVFNAPVINIDVASDAIDKISVTIDGSTTNISVNVLSPTVVALSRDIVVKINGTDVSDQVNWQATSVNNNLYSESDSAQLALYIVPGKYDPQGGDIIEIIDTSTTIFKGILVVKNKTTSGYLDQWSLTFKDWTEELGNLLIAEEYNNQGVDVVLQDIFSDPRLSTYSVSTTLTTTITNKAFDNVSVVQCLDELAAMCGAKWYVAPDKTVKFFLTDEVVAPFGISDDGENSIYQSLKFTEDLTKIINKITVKGDNVSAVSIEDSTSITQYGRREYYKEDNNIKAENEANQYAQALLEAYKDPIITATFTTNRPFLFSGQKIHVESTHRGIDEYLTISNIQFKASTDKRYAYYVTATNEKTVTLNNVIRRSTQVNSPTETLSSQAILQDIEFTSVDDNTISWSAGTVRFANGENYSIDAQANLDISGSNIVYFDKDASTTALQISTSFADGVGPNKRALCYVIESSVSTIGAAIIPVDFGGKMQLDGGTLITPNSILTDNLAANCITANKLATTNLITYTAQIADAIITSAKISSLNADVINAGTITGRTLIANGGSGADVVVSNIGVIEFKESGSVKAYLFEDSGALHIDADDALYLSSDEDISITAQHDLVIASENNVVIDAEDRLTLNYNTDGSGGDDMYIASNGSAVAKFTSGGKSVFFGDAQVQGDFSVVDDCIIGDDLDVNGTKNFKIQHPLKKNSWLRHSAVESDKVLLTYQGRAKTKNRKKTIILPKYVEVINKNIEYQLTVIGENSTIWVSKEFKNNKFEVMTSKTDIEFSWTITGERNDERMIERPFIPEITKQKLNKIKKEKRGKDVDIINKEVIIKKMQKKIILPTKKQRRKFFMNKKRRA